MSKHDATEYAAGLRALADMIEAEPRMLDLIRYSLSNMTQPLDDRVQLARFARITARHGAKITKKAFTTGSFFYVQAAFGPVVLEGFVPRDEVCERVVVATREVTEEVPDPEALAAVPRVKVTKTVEDYEWRCTPLLAGAAEPVAVG